MNDNSMIAAGCFVWLIGYVSNRVMLVMPGMEAIGIPNWLMPFLGKPPTKAGKQWALLLYNLRYQLIGVFALAWGCVIKVFQLDPVLFSLIGFFASLIFGHLSAKWLYKSHPYKWENDRVQP